MTLRVLQGNTKHKSHLAVPLHTCASFNDENWGKCIFQFSLKCSPDKCSLLFDWDVDFLRGKHMCNECTIRNACLNAIWDNSLAPTQWQ